MHTFTFLLVGLSGGGMCRPHPGPGRDVVRVAAETLSED